MLRYVMLKNVLVSKQTLKYLGLMGQIVQLTLK